jgi:hypothetical protein
LNYSYGELIILIVSKSVASEVVNNITGIYMGSATLKLVCLHFKGIYR